MKYTYLLINFLTILFPLLLSFDKRVRFYKSWKFIWPGLAISGIVFLGWDIFFTIYGIWSFNPVYISGIHFLKLPLEEILFFLTVPFSCIFIYECLNYYVKWKMPDLMRSIISSSLAFFTLLTLIFHYHRSYTAVTFGLLFILIVLLEYVIKVRWLNRFYLMFLVSLIPFYIVNGALTSLPVVLYNDTENLGLRVGTIPLEDHFYAMAMLLMNIGFFEYFRERNKCKP